MSAITNVWRQLVQRRLWPVAILLIAALAAVPLVLAEAPEPPAPTPAPADASAAGDAALALQPIVAQASAADRAKRRKVLGSRKNPFGLPKSEESGSAAPPSSTGSTTAQEPSSPAPSDSGATPPGSGGSPATGVPATPPASDPTPEPAPRKYAVHELTVRFGDAASGDLKRRSLERLQPLPSAEEPVLIYLGVLDDGKTAVFLVDHGIAAIGDGDCSPGPETCATIGLRAGDTEFLDVKDETGAVTAQYQLDLIKIHKSTTASAARAQASSKVGRRLLKARVAAAGPTGYRWDAAAGGLERRPAGVLRTTVVGAAVGLG
jgi:hypothetical protein